MREEDTTAAIHGGFTQRMREGEEEEEEGGGTDFTQSRERQKEGVESQRETEKKGLTIHKDTGCCSQVAGRLIFFFYTSTLPTCTHGHNDQQTPSHLKNTYEDTTL